MNFGLDWGLFKNRLNVTAEVYKMKTTNMLMDRGLPTLTGYSKVKANLGQVNNKGLEITISSVNLNTKNLRWTSDLTFSLNRNEIKHLYGDLVPVTDSDGNIVNWKESDDPTNGWYIGHAIDEIYDYKIVTGVWQNDEAAEAMALGFSPGDYKTYLKEGNTSYSTDDYLWQGYTKPRYRIALNNSFTLFDNLHRLLHAPLGTGTQEGQQRDLRRRLRRPGVADEIPLLDSRKTSRTTGASWEPDARERSTATHRSCASRTCRSLTACPSGGSTRSPCKTPRSSSTSTTPTASTTWPLLGCRNQGTDPHDIHLRH